jgi:hypothetical protein
LLANTLAAIDSGMLSLSIDVSRLAKPSNLPCVFPDRGRPDSAFLLRLFDALMGEPESSKGDDIITGERLITNLPLSISHYTRSPFLA